MVKTCCGCSNVEELTLGIYSPFSWEAELVEETKRKVCGAAAKLGGHKSLDISGKGKCKLPVHLTRGKGRLLDCIGSCPVSIYIIPTV